MSQKYTQDQAKEMLVDFGFAPLEPFPGKVHDPWKKICTNCKKENSTALAQIKSGIGCGFCHLERRTKKYAEDSKLKAIAAGYEPLENISGSRIKVKMRCVTCGWVGKVTMQSINAKRKCQTCAGRPKFDSDSAILEMQKAGFEPLAPYVNTSSRWKARCMTCGEIEFPRLTTIRKGHGCLNCSGSKKLDPNEAAKIMLDHGFEPLEPFINSNTPWKCKCLECGYISNKRLGPIRQGRAGCAKCNGTAKTTESDAIKILHTKSLTPLEPFKGRKEPWRVRCENCNEVFVNTFFNISSSNGCINCAGNRKITAEKARSLFESRDFEMIGAFESRTEGTKCRCRICGVIVYPELKTVMRKLESRGCTSCASIETKKRQTISHEEAARVMVEHGLEPLEEYPGNQKKWKCRCTTCGSVITPTRNYVLTSGNTGCRICSNLVIVSPEEAELELKDYGFEALEVFPGNTIAKWNMKCLVCGYESKSSLKQRRKGRSCLYCSRANRTYEQGTSIYVAYQERLQSLKVGVGGKRRFSQHKNFDWLILKTWRFDGIELPYKIESLILQKLRIDMEIPVHLLPESMPQGGHTETVSVDFITPADLIDLVDKAVAEFH